ncbi:hypothetical protein EZH22_24850 [Xanthobacter dioxanivorans]|uniref:Uncharacterized protein n=1 Tax=Xanthobacter dioxanivorans TaxID=2528964 RepID=A0A974SJ99_9HYPH|nr:hypothetical protein [Xanthobacter dioxanivorans]QRG06173.1 hypothetical protein EZH22_24850 [Xanthobacter dioxanivorans]
MTEEPTKPKKTVLDLITGTTGQVTAVMIALTAFLTQVPELKNAGQRAFCAVVSCAVGPDTAATGPTAGGSPASGSPASTNPSSGAATGSATGTGTVAGRLSALSAGGIDFSVAPEQMRDWLGNGLTPYPAVADALVALLGGKKLRQPVELDVIVGFYESRARSPRAVAEVDPEQLKAAVVSAYRERHGASPTDFQSLLQ